MLAALYYDLEMRLSVFVQAISDFEERHELLSLKG